MSAAVASLSDLLPEEQVVYVAAQEQSLAVGAGGGVAVASDDVAAVQESIAANSSAAAAPVKQSKGVVGEKKARRKRGKGPRWTSVRRAGKGGQKRKRAASDDPSAAASQDFEEDCQPPSKKRLLSDTSALLKYEHRLDLLPAAAFAPLDKKWISLYDKDIRHKHLAEGSFPVPWTSVLQRVAAKHGYQIRGVLPHYHRADPPIFEVRPDIVEEQFKDNYAGEITPARVYIPPTTSKSKNDMSVLAFSQKDRLNDKEWQGLATLILKQQEQQSQPIVSTEFVEASGLQDVKETPSAGSE